MGNNIINKMITRQVHRGEKMHCTNKYANAQRKTMAEKWEDGNGMRRNTHKKQSNASEWNELFISIEKGQVINFAFYFYRDEEKKNAIWCDLVGDEFSASYARHKICVCVWLKLAVCGKLFSTNEMKMREYTPYFSHVVFLSDSSGL